MAEWVISLILLIVSWILFTKNARDSRFNRKADMYESLSVKLSELYLLRIKHDRAPERHGEEFAAVYIKTFEYASSNKLIISSKVSSLSTDFLSCHNKPIGSMMHALNSVINEMSRELGYDVTDNLNQITRIEPLVQSLMELIAKYKK